MEYIRFLMENDLRWPEDPIISFYYHLRDFVETLSLAPHAEQFSILYNSQEGRIRVLCKDASMFLRQRMNFFKSVVAISATITPFPFYRDLLGFPIEKTIYERFSSPFSPERRKILINPDIDTRYRQREHSYDEIADILQEIIKLKKGRYFAFFPSFKYAKNVITHFDELEGLLLLKQKITMLESDRRKFIHKLETNPYVLAVGVTAGIFAEGIDFPGILDGIFIVSPSLPPVSFERELLRQYYEERFSNGFSYAYQFPGLTRTFQAAGRLIRTETDRGIIVFIGRRFATPYYGAYFPPYYYQNNPQEMIYSDPLMEIKQFWKKIETESASKKLS